MFARPVLSSCAPLILVLLSLPCTASRLKAQQGAPRKPWTTSKVQGSPSAPEPYQVRPSFPGVKFESPTSLAELPSGKRMLVTERGGKVFTFVKRSNVGSRELALDLTKTLSGELAGQGVSLFSAVLHPDFRNNGLIFFCYVHPADGRHTRVSRFQMSGSDPPSIDAKSEEVIIRWPAGGHNAGCLRFGKDGFLYIATGDGFGPNPPDNLNTGQDVSDLLGALLRIDVNRREAGKGYAIPADNPFVGKPPARPEIWAYGLRNPWKFGVDRANGEIYVADNGWESWEMIHRIQRGGNCGWPIMEGRAVLRSEVKPGPTPIIPPVKDHPHSEANSVIGGPIYRGQPHPDLQGNFIYGDYITGTIWALKTDGGDLYSHRTLVDTDLRIVDFCEGSQGELFVLDYDLTGQIFQLLPTEREDTSANFPRKLSQTGIFKKGSLESLTPAEGVIPYRIRASRWHDGARARRWVAIPGQAAISLKSNSKPADYPPGTVFVKHLEIGKKGAQAKPVETQLLHFENGKWSPYSYLWNEDGSDAELVPAIGKNITLRIPLSSAKANDSNQGVRERTWRAGATNECKLCHNAGSNYVLGFNAPQLEIPMRPQRQLAQFADLRVLTAAPKVAKQDPRALVNPHDQSQTLEARARSYLHANCGSCHHPGGNAIVSFYLRRDMPLEKLNTYKGTGIGTFGMQHAKLLTPGDPYRSVITYRMSKLGYGRMPYIGSSVVDSRGVALVAAWIESLEQRQGHIASAPVKSKSPEAKAIQLLESEDAQLQDRRAAINRLLQTTEGSLALANRLHQRKLDAKSAKLAIALGANASKGDVSGLFEHFLPESKRRAKLGANIEPDSILKRDGNAQRGKLIFFSDAARCRNCHDVKDAQRSVGPTLQEVANKYLRKAELLQHVLQPSLKIDEKLASYILLLKDGRSLHGLLQESTAAHVVIKTAEGKSIRVAAEDIEDKRKSPRSLMPEKILSDLTAQEAADLLSFIVSQRTSAGRDDN